MWIAREQKIVRHAGRGARSEPLHGLGNLSLNRKDAREHFGRVVIPAITLPLLYFGMRRPTASG